MKNWKTNLAAVLAAVVAGLTAFETITPEQGVAILAVLAAFGFGVAKDHNVTGGTKTQ